MCVGMCKCNSTSLLKEHDMKNFDPNKIKPDEKSQKNILIYFIGFVTIENSKYIKINTLSEKTLLGKIFVGENYLSPGKYFVTFP